METVKKILEAVNSNVTRQLLEASVQRVKSSSHPLATSQSSPVPIEKSLDQCTLNEGI